MTVLGSEFVVTRDPENVKAIYVTHGSNFEISTTRYDVPHFLSTQ